MVDALCSSVESIQKYYAVDVGLRNARLNFRQHKNLNEIKKTNPMRNSNPLILPPHAQPALKYLSKPRS